MDKTKTKLHLNQGYIPCAFCQGSGLNPHYRHECSVCKGIGQFRIEWPAIQICPDCQGNGRKKLTTLTCYRCEGRGVLPDVEKEFREGRAELQALRQQFWNMKIRVQ